MENIAHAGEQDENRVEVETPERPGGPVERPEIPPVRTRVKATRLDGTTAHQVGSGVTTDSVVATATVATNEVIRAIRVDWGDGQKDIVDVKPGLFVKDSALEGSEPLPEGTYQLYHVYDIPNNSYVHSFEHQVVITVYNNEGVREFNIYQIELTPRYRVTHYPISIWPLRNCDPSWHDWNKFEIVQTVGGKAVNKWTIPSPVRKDKDYTREHAFDLDESFITRELTYEDNARDHVIPMEFRVTEIDDSYNDEMPVIKAPITLLRLDSDKNGKVYTQEFHGDKEEDTLFAGNGCWIAYSYTVEMEIVTPLPTNDRAVYSSELLA